ncbi:MAG TPA: preprotein translocase subunit YajC [bacterium]|nr:preprotein translocase subunit YajC [bacterium]HPN43121.1 preprotein translocase subunit YajC [bacterium]
MNSIVLFVFAMATDPNSSGQTSGGNPAISLLPIVLIFLIMYLLIFRPQAKRQKEHRQMLDNLQKGDEVVTAGGIYGSIVGTKKNDTVVILKIAENVKIEVARSSIAQKVQPEEPAKN